MQSLLKQIKFHTPVIEDSEETLIRMTLAQEKRQTEIDQLVADLKVETMNPGYALIEPVLPTSHSHIPTEIAAAIIAGIASPTPAFCRDYFTGLEYQQRLYCLRVDFRHDANLPPAALKEIFEMLNAFIITLSPPERRTTR